MKKICFITSGVLPVPAVKGGAIEQLIEQLCEDNEKCPHYKFTVITKRDKNAMLLQKSFHHVQYLNFSQIVGFYYKLAWKARGFMRKITGRSFPQFHTYEFQTIQFLKKHCMEFDLVIAEGCDLDMLFSIARYVGKGNLCLHLHGDLTANPDCDNAFGYLISVSDFIRRSYLSTSASMPVEHTYVLLNGVDGKRFQKALTVKEKKIIRSQLGFSEDDFVIVFCGRIVPIKGVLELIHAVISISNPKIKLLIIGSSNFGNGNLNKYSLEVQKISEQNPQRIVYTGFIDNKDVYKYYRISSIGAVPSLWNEPCALVSMEMMHSGLATIATRVGGNPEIFTEETTIFIPFDSEVENNLKMSIIRLYNNTELCITMGQRALERAKNFTREIYYRNFCEIVDEILT